MKRFTHLRCRYTAVLAGLAAILVLGTVASAASAEVVGFEGKLGSKEWTCAKCDVQSELYFIHAEAPGPKHSVCVGPVQYNGKWVFPYGWNCSTESTVSWEFSYVDASEGVQNPGSVSYTYDGYAIGAA